MKAFPQMIAKAAEDAGIKLPPDLDSFDPEEYPHWLVFCRMQLGQPMPYPEVDYDNAKVIANLSEEEVKRVTPIQLIQAGFLIGFSY